MLQTDLQTRGQNNQTVLRPQLPLHRGWFELNRSSSRSPERFCTKRLENSRFCCQLFPRRQKNIKGWVAGSWAYKAYFSEMSYRERFPRRERVHLCVCVYAVMQEQNRAVSSSHQCLLSHVALHHPHFTCPAFNRDLFLTLTRLELSYADVVESERWHWLYCKKRCQYHAHSAGFCRNVPYCRSYLPLWW